MGEQPDNAQEQDARQNAQDETPARMDACQRTPEVLNAGWYCLSRGVILEILHVMVLRPEHHLAPATPVSGGKPAARVNAPGRFPIMAGENFEYRRVTKCRPPAEFCDRD